MYIWHIYLDYICCCCCCCFYVYIRLLHFLFLSVSLSNDRKWKPLKLNAICAKINALQYYTVCVVCIYLSISDLDFIAFVVIQYGSTATPWANVFITFSFHFFSLLLLISHLKLLLSMILISLAPLTGAYKWNSKYKNTNTQEKRNKKRTTRIQKKKTEREREENKNICAINIESTRTQYKV